VYNILTWNTGLTEKSENLNEILNFIKEYLDNENSVAVLQQIPYKNPEKHWEEHDIYKKFVEAFPTSVYSVIKNDNFNNGFIFMQTVIVTKLKQHEQCCSKVYLKNNASNREAAFALNDSCILLGIHAKNGSDNLMYIKGLKGEADIIVGDFNAGDYSEYKYWQAFREILPSHVCICNMPTKVILTLKGTVKRKSCIDHIFVRRNLVAKCSNIKVHENIKFSDHYPISFCIDL